MSDDKSKNPFEELQEQIDKFMKNPGAHAGLFGSMGAKAQPEEPQVDEPEEDSEVLRRIREFNLKPREIRDYLNRYVIQQHEAKKVLSVAICDHYNHVRACLEKPDRNQRDYSKQNILLLGPTGVGKTYLMRNIARLIGVPFVKADATKFSETGYVGADVEDLVRDLVKAANGNVELAEYGIIYVDEIDKIAGSGSGVGGKDVSGRGVQINLLKLMEDAEVSQFGPNDMMGQMQAMMMGRGGKTAKKTISTRHILFIVSGAFDKLSESVKKRLDQASIGFATQQVSVDTPVSEYLHRVESSDLIQYGFEPEFVGRLPVRVACDELSIDDLTQILTSSEGSLLRQYQDDFRGYGIDFSITPESLMEVARRAHGEKTGARGLMTVLERVFRDYKFELPSTAIREFEVTTDTIENPSESLKKLLLDNQHLQKDVYLADLKRFADDFENAHELRIEFADDAAESIIAQAVEKDQTIRAVCQELFKDFHHGLAIIARNTGRRKFVLNKEAAENPDKELSRWVVESFREKEANQPSEEPQKE